MIVMKKFLLGAIIGWVVLLFAANAKPDYPEEIPFVPTPIEVVDKMLELAEVKKGDVLYDLGSGDGRIVIRAAQKYGIRAVGNRNGQTAPRPSAQRRASRWRRSSW